MIDTETFVGLLKNPAYWEFELFLMFLQDVVLGFLILSVVRRHWRHHIDRDRRENLTSSQFSTKRTEYR